MHSEGRLAARASMADCLCGLAACHPRRIADRLRDCQSCPISHTCLSRPGLSFPGPFVAYALARFSSASITFQARGLYLAVPAGANERSGWRTGPYVLRTKKNPAWTKPRGGPQGNTMLEAHYVFSQLLGSIQFNGCKIDSQPVSHHCDTGRKSGSRAFFPIQSASALWANGKLHQRRALHAPQASFIVRGCHGHGRVCAGCRSASQGAPTALRAPVRSSVGQASISA